MRPDSRFSTHRDIPAQEINRTCDVATTPYGWHPEVLPFNGLATERGDET